MTIQQQQGRIIIDTTTQFSENLQTAPELSRKLLARHQNTCRSLELLERPQVPLRFLATNHQGMATLEVFRELGGRIDDDSALLVLDSHLDPTYSAALHKEMPHLHDSAHSAGWARMDTACATLVKLDSDEMVRIILRARAEDETSSRRVGRRLREVRFAGRESRSRSSSPVHCYACGGHGHISTEPECPCYGMSREESRQWRRRQAAGERNQPGASGGDQPSRDE